MPTVELREAELAAAEAHHTAVSDGPSLWWHLQGWILAILLGVASAISGQLIEMAVTRLSTFRFGYCRSHLFTPQPDCIAGPGSESAWVYWGDGLGIGFLANIGLGTAFAAASGLLVYFFAPAASGSGIPEVKTILNGFVMPDAVSLRTLLVKVPGLALSVSSGMALGKEGPLVHVAVCWAQCLSGVFPQFQNEVKRRELISAAAAAGVATAFGAPLGGVLFSLEEVSSQFPPTTLLRSFTAAMSAALMLSLMRGQKVGLTLFSVGYSVPANAFENICFVILGIFGGLIGAAFNGANVRWSAFRRRPAFRSRVPAPLEVTLIAVVTLLTSWPLRTTRLLSANVIHALFEPCTGDNRHLVKTYLGFCTEHGYAEITGSMMLEIALACFIRFVQMTLTFGTACPAGLFVPSLFVGSCLGRCFGVAMRWLNLSFITSEIEPGVYAMVGAAAVLGGVCRVTISLVAIMLELTGSMAYIVPFMIAVLTAKVVGDSLNEGIYDLHIVLKGYPFLQAEANMTFNARCCDIMETRLTTLDVSKQPRMRDIREVLEAFNYHGFPVVNDGHFVGYARRHRLEAHLERLATSNPPRAPEDVVSLGDLLPCTDCTVMRMVPDASLSEAHKVFSQLGCKNIFLVGSSGHNPTQDVLQGILTKKRFLLSLQSGRVGHMSELPAPANGSAASARSVGLHGATTATAGSPMDGHVLWRTTSGGVPRAVEPFLQRDRGGERTMSSQMGSDFGSDGSDGDIMSDGSPALGRRQAPDRTAANDASESVEVRLDM